MLQLKFKTILLFCLALFLSSGTNILAQRGNGNTGWGQNSTYGKRFNPQTIKTIKGTVVAVERISPYQNMSYGIHLKVKTKDETIAVHLGPAWYLDNQEIRFSEGDEITVMGSKITFQDIPAIIAAEIELNKFVLHLRDPNGYPIWSGWRKRGMWKGRTRG